MSVDERSRLQLAEALKRALGDDEGITLMELLPPVGWADVATKHDLLMLEGRMETRLESFEGRMEMRLESFEGRMESLESRIDARIQISESRMEAKFERGFRQVMVTTASLMVSGFIATIVAVIAR
jgi:hypothetical protein